MSTSKQTADFLDTGKLPQSTKERSAMLAVLRNQILTNNQNEIMKLPSPPEAIITASMTADYMIWKKSNPSGTAQEFIASKTAPKKPSATIAAFAVGIDPGNLPKLKNGMIDALAVTNALGRQKAAELAAASASVSARRAPNRTVINRSRYSQP